MITEQYILMCREAKELQEDWKPKDGDSIWHNLKVGFVKFVKKHLHFIIGDDIVRPMVKEEAIWLPSQEDLQEIHYNSFLGQHISTTEKSFHRWFWQEYNNKEKSCLEQYDWNEIWLCFVMNKVYDKQWNGTTWETIK